LTIVKPLDAYVNSANIKIGKVHKHAFLDCQTLTMPYTGAGLVGAHQRINAALALQLCDTWTRKVLNKTLVHEDGVVDETALQGFAQARWPGRAQTLRILGPNQRPEIWRMDGAHTPESMQICSDWYLEACTSEETSDVTRPKTRQVYC
jgi:folylpolyglutamate synthase/dihydropteroate synthase